MKSISLLFIFIAISINIKSQIVKVKDKTTLQPIEGVLIYDKGQKNTLITNIKGEADISNFNKDSLIFQIIGYQIEQLSFSDIESNNFVIMMSDKGYELKEMIVSANRFELEKNEVAQHVDIITSKQISFANQQTTGDLLQNTGNIMVQKSQAGGGSPIIRGFEANKVLMVVDGVRMNNAIYRGGHLQNIITLNNMELEKVEILYGAGSLMYGSDALGGVMSFYTKKPHLADTSGNMLVKVNALTRYSTANNEQTGHVDFNIGFKKFASLTSFTYSNFGDLMQGNNRNPFYGDFGKRDFYVKRVDGKDSVFINDNVNLQKQSGYQQYNMMQKFLIKHNKNVNSIINLQYSTSSNIPRYDRLIQLSGGNPRTAQWYYGPQERLFAAYHLTLSNKNKLYSSANITLAYQQIEESRHDRRFNNVGLNHRTENLNIFSVNADFEKKLNKHTIEYGIESVFNEVKSKAEKENIVTGEITSLDTRYPDGGSTMLFNGVYLTHHYKILDNLILSDGIRISQVQLESEFIDTTFYSFLDRKVSQNNIAPTVKLGLVYSPNTWKFSLMGSSAFRAPNVDDMGKVFESVPGNIIVPNPNLKPEYTYNLDLGISKTFNIRTTIGTNAYYTLYQNAIVIGNGQLNGNDSIVYQGQLSNVTTSVNKQEAYIYGVNAYLNADITNSFSLYSTINYTYGRIKTDTTEYPLDHIPPVFGKTGLVLKLNKFRGEFNAIYNGWKRKKDYNLIGEDNFASATPHGMPAWVTLNLNASYQINKSIQFQLGLENILDQNYKIFASGIHAPGRNLILTLKGSF